jgi:hypothetical protein
LSEDNVKAVVNKGVNDNDHIGLCAAFAILNIHRHFGVVYTPVFVTDYCYLTGVLQLLLFPLLLPVFMIEPWTFQYYTCMTTPVA